MFSAPGNDFMGGGGPGGAMEASFKEFLARPENQPILEKHQRKEVKQALKLQEKIHALKFRSTVLDSDYDAQLSIAPFLKNRVLKKVVMTFANDPNGDFEQWAKNPRVIEMLSTAQKMMDEGRMTEDEMEEYFIRLLKDPSNEFHEEFEAKTRQVARLPTDQLVQALNEHLVERRKGNDAYRKGTFAEALHHYVRAKSIVDLVQGLSQADQIEVISNRIAVNCNIAAVNLATKDFGAAVRACDDALELDPECQKALARKAKALIGRHEYDAADQVIEHLRDLNMLSEELPEIEKLMRVTKVQDKKSEASFRNMFGNSTQ
ncbi:hypothetical protein M9435_000866 [Picochlorum sp. BPE23]|nr:hypothetical protein M9435_000866 [Picochlorum sp. BPE23]